MTDYSDLKAACLALAEGGQLQGEEATDAMLVFEALAGPDQVLALIAEVETLESYLCACPDCGGQGEIFAGGYSYFGHMDPPEPNMDKCGSCDGEGFIGTPQELHTVLTERDQLKAEVEALRKDAERYLCALTTLRNHTGVSGNQIDMIDAAMSKEAGHD